MHRGVLSLRGARHASAGFGRGESVPLDENAARDVDARGETPARGGEVVGGAEAGHASSRPWPLREGSQSAASLGVTKSRTVSPFLGLPRNYTLTPRHRGYARTRIVVQGWVWSRSGLPRSGDAAGREKGHTSMRKDAS